MVGGKTRGKARAVVFTPLSTSRSSTRHHQSINTQMNEYPEIQIIEEFISSHPRVYIKDFYEDPQVGEIKMVLQSDKEGGRCQGGLRT